VTSTAIAVRSAASRAGLRTAITFDAGDGTTSIDARRGTEEQRLALAEAVVRIAAEHKPPQPGSLMCGTRLEHISTLACYNERLFHLVVRYTPMMCEVPAHHMPSFTPLPRATLATAATAASSSTQAAQGTSEQRDGRVGYGGYHLEPADLNFPALARREAQAVAVLAVISDMLSSPPLAGDTRLLPLTITESAGSHVWVSYIERGLVHGESIDTLMRRAYADAGAAGIGSVFVVDTVPADHKHNLAAVTVVRVGFNTEGLTREKRHALTAALEPLAQKIISADSAFIWASSAEGAAAGAGGAGGAGGGAEHHAQMAAVTVRPNVTIRITDPHGFGPLLADVPVMPTATVFGRIFLNLGVAFGVSVSPALQGQEPTCMVWSAAVLLAHLLEPANRAQSMWLTTLVSVLYRRSICVDGVDKAQATKDAECAEYAEDSEDAEDESDTRPNTAKRSVKRKLPSTRSTTTSVSTSIRTSTTTTTTKSESTKKTRTSDEEPSVIVISDSE
jgi:hypothetical protein